MEEPILNVHNKEEHRPSHTAENFLNKHYALATIIGSLLGFITLVFLEMAF